MVQKRHSNVSEASLAGIAWGLLKARQTFIDTDKCNEHRNLFQGSDASKKREKRTMIMEPSIKINHTFQKKPKHNQGFNQQKSHINYSAPSTIHHSHSPIPRKLREIPWHHDCTLILEINFTEKWCFHEEYILITSDLSWLVKVILESAGQAAFLWRFSNKATFLEDAVVFHQRNSPLTQENLFHTIFWVSSA